MTGPGSDDAQRPDTERQRAELAETVEELAHRIDVPARTKAAVHEKTDTAVQIARKNKPGLAVAGGSAIALLVLRAVRRRNRRH